MTALYRGFTLTDRSIWQRIVDFVSQNARPAAERGKPLYVIVTTLDADRHDTQIAFYWGTVLATIAENVADEQGEFRAAIWWHEKLTLEFLGMTEHINPRTNKIIRRRRSTARGQISVGDMAEYLNKLQAWGADQGIVW